MTEYRERRQKEEGLTLIQATKEKQTLNTDYILYTSPCYQVVFGK